MTDPCQAVETGSFCRFSEMAENNFTFAECIACQRKALRLTQARAAKLVQISERTWREWESGRSEPAAAVQQAVVAMLEEAQVPPSGRRRASLRRVHHLYWERHKGWFLRLTIDRGPRLIGTRVKIRLFTHLEAEAIARRSVVIAAYRRLGLKFQTRIQRGRKS